MGKRSRPGIRIVPQLPGDSSPDLLQSLNLVVAPPFHTRHIGTAGDVILTLPLDNHFERSCHRWVLMSRLTVPVSGRGQPPLSCECTLTNPAGPGLLHRWVRPTHRLSSEFGAAPRSTRPSALIALWWWMHRAKTLVASNGMSPSVIT